MPNKIIHLELFTSPINATNRRHTSVAMVLPKRQKRYYCTYKGCEKAYTRPCLLEEHKRSHDNTRPFECEICGKSFFRETHLKSHKWTHADTKPLGCRECEKRFITNQQLQRHERTHLRKTQSGLASSPSDSSATGATPYANTENTSPNMTPMTLIKFDCPFDCAHSFLSVAGLTDHMLEEHILVDTIDVNSHLRSLQNDLNEFGIPEDEEWGQYDTSWNGLDWTRPFCHEPMCHGMCPKDRKPSKEDVLLHYSSTHEYVPESLLEDYLSDLGDGIIA